MKIILAPDSFKGSLSAVEVCQALRQGISRIKASIEAVQVPLADGGEGTVDALVHATGGRFVSEVVEGPLGDSVNAQFGILGDEETAVIEMAAASGLPLLSEQQRDPTQTTTYGTGQLIKAALDADCRSLIIGIGGSATTDGGAGVAQALGARMLDSQGQAIPRVSGGQLQDIASIDISKLDRRLSRCTVQVACDVDNPLLGSRGAAQIYSPQKGASPDQVKQLEVGLAHYAKLLEGDLGKAVADIPGAGAAGGLGAGLLAFCDATLVPGIELVVEAVKLAENAAGADLIITGEGRLDGQTAFGKAPTGALSVGNKLDIPVIAIGGSITPEGRELTQHGFAALFSCLPTPMSLAEAMEPQTARDMLSFVGEQIVRTWLAGRD